MAAHLPKVGKAVQTIPSCVYPGAWIGITGIPGQFYLYRVLLSCSGFGIYHVANVLLVFLDFPFSWTGCLEVDRTASGSSAASRSSSTLWFQVPLGLVLVLRNHETCVSPSRHETCVLPSRLVPRGRPHRLGVVPGLEVVLHLLVPSLTWIIYAHGICVSPSRLVPRGRPHRLGVVRGIEVVLHLLVPSPTWIIYAHRTCVLPSHLVPRGRPHHLGVVRGLEVVLHPLVPSPT
nr:hypothetical protein Iba_chr01dCG0590 [Ipomoea batatas]